MKLVNPSVELIWITPQPELNIELAGKTCYKSEPKIYKDCPSCEGTGKYTEVYGREVCEVDCIICQKRSSQEFISKILTNHHESVLEHSSASVRIITDRGLLAEITRHRLFSYSVESSRYCNYSKDKFGNELTFIQPSELLSVGKTKEETNNYLKWVKCLKRIEKTYLYMVNNGCSAQNARSILPSCLKTEISMTGNVRSWRNFFNLRIDKAAHPDMQILAKKIFYLLYKEIPNCLEDIKINFSL